MKKIAIIGTENSHASAFADMLKTNTDVTVIGAFGTDKDANTRFTERFGIDCSSSSDAFVDEADGVMITSRRGSTHFESALPYLKKGKTVFIDKPITVNTEQSVQLAAIAENNGAKLCGGSCLKYADSLLRLKKEIEKSNEQICAATLCAPVELESPYDGFFFYSQHLVEMCLTVFGSNVKSVHATRNDDKICAVLNYGNFSVSLFFGSNIYRANIVFQNYERRASVTNILKLYRAELNYFVSLLNGNEMKHTYHDVIFPVLILNAIFKSFTNGCEVLIDSNT